MFDFIYDITNYPILKTGVQIIDIITVAALFYNLYAIVANTRGFAVLQGFALILIVTFLARFLNFQTLYWLLDKVFGVSLIAIIVLFQAEIKRGLIIIGQNTLFQRMFSFDEQNLYKIINAVYTISKKKAGALIVIQRKIALQGIVERAVILKSEISTELLETIYYHHNPLHDGAVIIDRDRIVAASAYLPLTETDALNESRRLGTRHRAALGISEQSDAVVIIVSEETSAVSLAVDGRLYYNLGREELGTKLGELLGVESERREK